MFVPLRCLLAVLLPIAGAIAELPPWEAVRQHHPTTRVWTRPRPKSAAHEVRAERLIDASPERVWEVLNDVGHYHEFMPYVVEARQVARRHHESFEYFRLDPPVIKQRDYTISVRRSELHAAHRYVRRWQAANNEGPPPRRDSIRLALCDGSWTVEPAPNRGPGCTRLRYWLHTDPAGAVPGWLARRASSTSIPALLEAVAQRSTEPGWRRD